MFDLAFLHIIVGKIPTKKLEDPGPNFNVDLTLNV